MTDGGAEEVTTDVIAADVIPIPLERLDVIDDIEVVNETAVADAKAELDAPLDPDVNDTLRSPLVVVTALISASP